MDAPTPEFALAGSLAELRAKGRWLFAVAIVRFWCSTTEGASLRSTIGVRT
jgi:hypothetical protein